MIRKLLLRLFFFSLLATTVLAQTRYPGVLDRDLLNGGPPALASTKQMTAKQQAPTFSAAADFSAVKNPNGPWSYGFESVLGGPFTLYQIAGTTFFSGEVGWFGPIPGGSAPGFPLVVAEPVTRPDVLDMGPGPNTVTVVRWTASAAGVYDVYGEFFGTGANTVGVHVLQNGVPRFEGPIFGSDVQPFSLKVQLNAGDTVDFAVDPGPDGNHDFDPTGMRAIVAPHLYDFTVLDFPGAAQTRFLAVNDQGDAVGDYVDSDGNLHALLYRDGQLSNIDPPGAVGIAQAVGINVEGEVTGEYLDNAGFFHGFLLSQGRYQNLDFPGVPDSQATGINERHHVVGSYDLGDQNTSIGFVMGNGASRSFEVLDSSPQTTLPRDISNDGLVVGQYQGLDNAVHGFLLSNGTFTAIDVPGTTETIAAGINSAGQISGSYRDGNGVEHAFLRRNRQFLTFDFPVARSTTRGRGLSDRGVIVGSYRILGDAGRHAFIARPALGNN
jgi:hypothetical protein